MWSKRDLPQLAAVLGLVLTRLISLDRPGPVNVLRPHDHHLACPHARQLLQLDHGRHWRADVRQHRIDAAGVDRLDRFRFPGGRAASL